ncbi:MAG TPA: alpha/beta fold hydrolase [Tepidisphaeraceae bacterium]
MKLHPWRWIKMHRKRVSLTTLLALAIALNAVAYMHAYAMTHFVPRGERTENPLHLSSWQKVKIVLTGVTLPRPYNPVGPEAFGLSYKTVNFAVADGTTLEGWVIPADKPKGTFIGFHGYATAKCSLLGEAKVFHELGYSVLLVDFRGSGGSGGNVTTIGYREADDVAATVAYAQANLPARPLIVFGQSMGSAAILRAVAHNNVHPDLLLLESPFDRLFTTVQNRFHTMGLPAFPLANLLTFWGGVQQGYSGFKHNPAEYAASVHCPVLLMHGRHDPWVTDSETASIFQGFAGEKQLDIFEQVGHEPYLDHEPEHWNNVVRDFVARHAR